MRLNNPQTRIEHVITNSERFGTSLNLTPICGEAPACCDALPDPDSVFVGGSGGGLGTILDYAWQRLKPAGKLIASAVTRSKPCLVGVVLQKQTRSRVGHTPG